MSPLMFRESEYDVLVLHKFVATYKWTRVKTRPSDVSTAHPSDTHKRGTATVDACCCHLPVRTLFSRLTLGFL